MASLRKTTTSKRDRRDEKKRRRRVKKMRAKLREAKANAVALA